MMSARETSTIQSPHLLDVAPRWRNYTRVKPRLSGTNRMCAFIQIKVRRRDEGGTRSLLGPSQDDVHQERR